MVGEKLITQVQHLKMEIESKYKFGLLIKNGKPFYGEVVLKIESTPNMVEHQIIERYKGEGFITQGYVETIPKKGYNSWKEGVKNGVLYGLKMVTDNRTFKVTILAGNGLITHTNPIILAYVASRAILEKIEHRESVFELEKIKNLVFSSWNYEHDSQIDFKNFTIIES